MASINLSFQVLPIVPEDREKSFNFIGGYDKI